MDKLDVSGYTEINPLYQPSEHLPQTNSSAFGLKNKIFQFMLNDIQKVNTKKLIYIYKCVYCIHVCTYMYVCIHTYNLQLLVLLSSPLADH